MSDYYRTIGFQRDKAQLLSVLNRIAAALERIADKPEAPGPISSLESLRLSDLTDEEAEKFWEALNEDA